MVYKTLTKQSHKEYIRLDKRFKRNTPFQMFRELVKFDVQFVNTLDFSILCEEYLWTKSGSKILFPGNEFFFSRLYNAEMTIEDTVGFVLPFESFVVSVPNGLELHGRKIPSFQVNFLDYSEYNSKVIKPFCNKCEIPVPNVKTIKTEPGQRLMSINYPNEGGHKTGRTRFVEIEGKLPRILKAKTINEMKEVVAPMNDKYKSLELDDSDIELQSIMLKLVASLGVYYVATDKKSVVPGMPDIKGISVDRGTDYKPTNFKFANGNVAPKTQSEHVRGWSFRQLKHERYYRGEYEKLEPGSRILFVDSYIAGVKAEAHKIKEK